MAWWEVKVVGGRFGLMVRCCLGELGVMGVTRWPADQRLYNSHTQSSPQRY